MAVDVTITNNIFNANAGTHGLWTIYGQRPSIGVNQSIWRKRYRDQRDETNYSTQELGSAKGII